MGKHSGGLLAPLANASVSVFSVDPRAVGTPLLTDLQGLSTSSNGYYDEIAQGQTGINGTVSFDTPKTWSTITSAWAAVTSPLTSNVSFRVDVTYVDQTPNGTDLFHGSENIPFTPGQSVPSLAGELVLDLSHPVSVITPPSGRPVSASCKYQMSTTWADSEFSLSHGPLPIAWLDNNATRSPTVWLFLTDFWGQFQSVTIGFPSVQAFGSSVTASSAPSWEGTLPQFGYVNPAIMASVVNGSYDGAALVMDNVSILAVDQSENVTLSAPGCPSISQLVPVLTLSVPNAFESSDLNNCAGFACEEGWLQAWTIPSSWTYLLATLPNQSIVSSAAFSPGGSHSWQALSGKAQGLSAAGQAEAGLWGTQFTFPLNLGEGLLYMDLPSGCDNSNCTSFCRPCVESDLGTQLGFALPMVRALSPIAFVLPQGQSGGRNEVQSVQLSYHTQNASDPTVQLKLEGAGMITDLTVGGNTYAYFAPSAGVIACPASVTLEPWAEC